MTTHPPRAAIYVRVSTTGQEEGSSLETQEAACRAYAAEQGFTVTEDRVYREVHTGAELWERPKLAALREAVRRREVDAVIVYAIDRLSRDPVHLGVIISEAEHAGADVRFVTEPLDNSPEGQLIQFVRGYAAKVEREKLKERSMRGKLARAQAGKLLPGNRARYGYRWNADRTAYAEDPVTAPTVRRMFAWVLEGETLRGVAARLTTAGVPTPTGRQEWRAQSVRDILTDPLYTGVATTFRHRAVRNPLGRYTMTRRPLDEQVHLPEGTVPALIDAERFEAVRARLTLNRQWARRNLSNPEIALLRAGYARCGYCGSSMSVDSFAKAARPRSGQYKCMRERRDCGERPHISLRLLDEAVWERVEAILTDPTVIARELVRMQAADLTAADLDAVDRQIADVRRKVGNLTAHLADLPPVAAEAVREQLAALSRRLEALSAERAHILTRRAGWERATATLTSVQAWCATVAARAQGLTYDQKRLALEALGVRAHVWRQGHTPRYRIEASIPLEDTDGPAFMARSPASSSRPRWRECAGPISASRRA